MGAAAAIGGLLLGARAGKQATAPAVTSQQQSQQGSTQQSSSSPWIGAQPGLNTLYNAATNYFNTSPGPQYYPDQTVADQSWDTQHGLNMAHQRALAGGANLVGAQALDTAQNQAISTVNGGYLNNNPAQAALEYNSNFNANHMAGMGGLGAFGAGGMVGQTAGMDNLANVAYGNMLNSNPYVDQMFNQAAGQVGQNYAKNVMPGVASMFAGAGRYGSEAMNNSMDNAQQQYGNQINQLASNIYGGNYANERGLQQGAMNQMSNIGSQERQQQLGALNSLTGNQLQGEQLKLGNLNTLTQAYGQERQNMMTAIGMAPALSQADYTDVNNMLGAGAMRDQYQQSLIDANKARFDYGQMAPQNNLTFLNSIMSGAPQQSSSSGSSYGNSSGSGMQPGNPMAPMQGALMGSMLGTGLYNMF